MNTIQTHQVLNPSNNLAQAWGDAINLLKNAGVSAGCIDLVKAIQELNAAMAGAVPADVTARVIVGAESAYACISGNPFSLDVRLDAGMAASTSLRNCVIENRLHVMRLLRQTTRTEYAATLLAEPIRKPELASI